MKLIKFYKKNCAPCAQLAVVLERELKKYPDLVLEEYIIPDHLELAVSYGVTSVPHVFLIDDFNIEVGSQKGVLGVSAFLEKHLG